ncbi:MAG: PAS domain S-box protein [Candidatus Aminicenantales bacterium]
MKPLSIAARRRVKKTINKSEDKYRLLIENSPEVLYTLDAEGVFMFVSPAWTTLLGHPVDQVIGKPFQQFIHPDDRERCLAFLKKTLETGQRQTDIEYRVHHADGTWRWHLSNGFPVKDEAGKVIGYGGIANDITERKPAEEERRESEERSRLIYENMRDTAWLLDMSFKATWISPSVVRTLGFAFEELQNSTLDQHMTPASMALLAELTAKRLSPENIADKSKEVVIDGEFEFYRKDGTTFLGDTVASLLRNKDGSPIGFLCIVRDVTARKRAEEALRVSEARYRLLVENAQEAILVAQDGFLKFVNRMTIEMTGYPEPELLSRPFSDFIHPDDREMVVNHYLKRMAGDSAQPRYAIRLVTRDGGIKWVEIGAVLIDWEGRPSTLNFLTDITDRHKGEEVIQASLREKEVLLREIHHRVKNNLQVVSSLFNLQAGKILDRAGREIFKEGQTRIMAMSLVHEKLCQSYDLANIDLAAYIRSLAGHLFRVYSTDPDQIRLETDFREVHLDIDSAVPCGLILNELISNSLKHAFPEGRKGILRIEVKRGPDNTIVLRVADDGIGFPKDFNFRQSDGLGLQIATLLVSQLEATIDLEQTNGTAFIVTFRELKYMPRI